VKEVFTLVASHWITASKYEWPGPGQHWSNKTIVSLLGYVQGAPAVRQATAPATVNSRHDFTNLLINTGFAEYVALFYVFFWRANYS